MTYSELASLALNERNNAYAPYSGFSVGAALLCSDGSVYTGCNIENASFSVTVCAERVAFFKAIADGKRDFMAIAIAGGKKGMQIDELCAPCGVCRQVMAEFCDPNAFDVILVKTETDYQTHKLKDIFPLGFTAENL